MTPAAALAVVLLAAALPAPAAAQRADRDVAALVAAGTTALDEDRFGDAFDAFGEAARLEPREPSLSFAAGYAAARLGRLADARALLERALQIDPRYTDASIVLGQVLYREGKSAEAVRVYESALKYAPGHVGLTSGIEEWRKDSQLHDRFYQATGAHFTVLFEGPADETAARRVVELLEESYWRVGRALSVYPTEPVTVVLYTRQQFRDVTRSPDWSGAVFDGRIRLPIAGSYDRADDLRRVLEHEYVHAVAATLVGSAAPVWLNEGLAGVLEPGGVEWADMVLAGAPRRLPFERLERGFAGLSGPDATLAYAQSTRAVKRILDLRGAPAVG
jgi:tetratricopeptide (TPR) repeat protein